MARESLVNTSFAQLIEDGILEIGDGYRAKNEELGGDGPIFLRAGHVTDTHIDFAGVERFRAELAERLRAKMSRPGDTIVTTKGNSTGRTSFVTESMPPFVYSPHLSYWRSINPKWLAAGFLRYWARSAEFGRQLAAMKVSTDMAPYLSLTDQRRLTITLPPPEEQRAIACILGALDDKIELNRRMNQTLEAMARAIFKSWFVDFDPVRAKAAGKKPLGLKPDLAALFPDSFEDSELGKIPRGWKPGTLGVVAQEVRDAVSPSEIEGGTPYIALEHIPRRCIALDSWGLADDVASGKLRFRCGDILFGKLRPYFHKVGPAPIDGVCSTDIVVVRPSDDCWYGLVLGHMADDAFVAHTDRASTGTKMPRTNWGDMAAYLIVVPGTDVGEQYTKIVSPLVKKMHAGIMQSRVLATLRDALLPKLISGELRVADAGRIVSRCT